MTSERSTSFTDDRADYLARQATGELIVLTPALHQPSRIRPVAEAIRAIATAAESVNTFNSASAFMKLRRLRADFADNQPTATAMLRSCTHRVGEPVEGATSLELGWVQGFTFAAGISAFTELNAALSSASEARDRKAAYAMAIFSLYIAIVSLVATVVLGLLSLK